MCRVSEPPPLEKSGKAGTPGQPIRSARDLGRELKRWTRQGPRGPVKVTALAKRMRVSQSTLYAYLSGTTVPSTETLDKLLSELGVPADEHGRLATARDALERPRGPVGKVRRTWPLPAELPAEPSGFTGRSRELDALTRLIEGDATPAAVSIAVVSGPAGVGKTALAVRWGRQVTHQFPDGCLYTDLHGYSPVEPSDPAAVLAGFLRSLGLDDADIPDGGDERAARFRSVLAHRRVLVVLDNALDVDQVRPLLPGGPDCFVMITSRAALDGLQVRPGAHRIDLRPLPAAEGVDLLRAHLGTRVTRSAAAARDLAERCGGLPLALRIVAARARGAPDQPLEGLVADLVGQGLDLLDVGDPETAVRTVFSWSLRHLDDQSAQDFRLMGAHPAHDIGLTAAAALLGVDEPTAGRRLDVLLRAHLIQRPTPDRYDMHDLVRAYARELPVDSAVLTAALGRLVEHFAGAAAQVMDVLHPEPRVESTPVVSVREAREWLDTEWHTLLALVAFTARQGWSESTGRLAVALQRHLDQGGKHADALAVLGHVRDAARTARDKSAEGAALSNLGVAYLRLGRYLEAMDHHLLAIEVCRQGGDRCREAGGLNNLGNVYERLGRYQEAMDHYRQALVLADELDLRVGRAVLLTNLGVVHTRLGDHEQALRDCADALAIFSDVGDMGGTARTLGNIAEAHRVAGRPEEALRLYKQALEQARAIGARGIETEILNNLGTAHLATGDDETALACHTDALTAARAIGDRYEEASALEGIGSALRSGEPWKEALTIYRQLGVPEAERVQAQLSRRS